MLFFGGCRQTEVGREWLEGRQRLARKQEWRQLQEGRQAEACG
jgi:hypothetical protein